MHGSLARIPDQQSGCLRREIYALGTRIPVTVILDSLAEGATKDEVLVSYPSLRLDHINSALAYAAELRAKPNRTPRKPH